MPTSKEEKKCCKHCKGKSTTFFLDGAVGTLADCHICTCHSESEKCVCSETSSRNCGVHQNALEKKDKCDCICHDEGTWKQKKDETSTHHKSQCPCYDYEPPQVTNEKCGEIIDTQIMRCIFSKPCPNHSTPDTEIIESWEKKFDEKFIGKPIKFEFDGNNVRVLDATDYKEVKDFIRFLLSHSQTQLRESIIKKLEIKLKEIGKGYDHNDIESAQDYYGIAGGWEEIIRYEDGIKEGFQSALTLIKEL